MNNPVIDRDHEWFGLAKTVFPRMGNRKGGNPEEWPERLRVRQFPTLQTDLVK